MKYCLYLKYYLIVGQILEAILQNTTFLGSHFTADSCLDNDYLVYLVNF